MEDKILVNTFEMLLDQITKLQIDNELIKENNLHEARYVKLKNEPIFGKLFGFPFNIRNFEWDPKHSNGHIVFQIKHSILHDIFDNIWLEEDFLKIKEKDLAYKLKKHIQQTLTKNNYDLLFLNMKQKDLYNDHGIKEELISSFVLQNIQTNYIQTYYQDKTQIRIFFGKNESNTKQVYFKNFTIDNILNHLLNVLKPFCITNDVIKEVQFTYLQEHVHELMKFYDFPCKNVKVRDDMVIKYITNVNDLNLFKLQLESFKNKLILSDYEFFRNNFTLHEEEYDYIMYIYLKTKILSL